MDAVLGDSLLSLIISFTDWFQCVTFDPIVGTFLSFYPGIHLYLSYFYSSDVEVGQKYSATVVLCQEFVLCVWKPTGYPFFPLSCPAGSANTFCCLFVGIVQNDL